MGRYLVVAVSLVCVVLASPPAPAAPAAKDAVAVDVRALNSEAQTEYDLGHHRKSLGLYENLYKLRPLPALLFNIAQCHRKLGELKEAANTYRAFIVYAEPGSAEMVKAQELLAQVETALTQTEAAAKVAPNETFQSTAPRERPPAPASVLVTAPPTPHRPVTVVTAPPPRVRPVERSRTTSYVLGGIGIAALVGGSVMGLISNGAGNELGSGPHTRAEVDSLSSTKSTGAKAADVLFLLSLGLGAGAVFAW